VLASFNHGKKEIGMTFGQRLRELRKARNLSQKALADKVGINFTYLSKIENERLDFAQFPSEELIRKLASALEADEGELMILARKIPEQIKKRVMERPDAFRKFADLDDKTIDQILEEYGDEE
jgi:transcriptional regulator with XRE-family HTH domain